MRTTILFIAAAVLLGIAGYALVPGDTIRTGDLGGGQTISGTVSTIALGAQTITIVTEESDEVILALVPDTDLRNSSGDPVSIVDFVQGSVVEAFGSWTGFDSFIPQELVLVMSSTGEGADVDDCPSEVGESDRNSECRMRIASRIIVSLPKGGYDFSRLAVEPARKIGEVSGSESGQDADTKLLEAVEVGQAVVTVPSSVEGGTEFRLTVYVYEPLEEGE